MTDERRGANAPASRPPPTPDELEATQAIKQAEEILQAIELLPPDRRGALTRVLVSEESYSGPVPSPRILAGMETVVPGSARQIIDMAVRQQNHDHAFVNAVLKSESSYRLLTLGAAILILFSLVIGSVICAVLHETTAAVTLGGVSGLSVLAGVLLKGRDLFQSTSETPKPAAHTQSQPGRQQRKKYRRG